MTVRRPALILGDGDLAVQFYLDFGNDLDVRIEGFVQDHNPNAAGRVLEGLPVYSPDSAAHLAPSHGVFSVIGAEPRAMFVERVEALGFRPVTVIHPLAVVSPHCEIAPGACVYPLAGIAARARIGRHALIGRHAIIGHDTIIGDYTTVSAGCLIAGHASAGRQTYLGIGAVCSDHVSLGNRVRVGAGSVVIRDAADGVTLVGNPARVLGARGPSIPTEST